MAVILAGGGFKRGYIHGVTDAGGMSPTAELCTPGDIAATIFNHLGIDTLQELKPLIKGANCKYARKCDRRTNSVPVSRTVGVTHILN